MQLVRENIFDLNHPEFYSCYLERYQSNFFALRLRLDRLPQVPLPDRNTMELVFTSTLYYNGVFNWIGANVCIASQEDFLKRLFDTHILNSQTDDEEIEETLETYRLYVVISDHHDLIQFIASATDYACNIIS